MFGNQTCLFSVGAQGPRAPEPLAPHRTRQLRTPTVGGYRKKLLGGVESKVGVC